MSDLQIGLVVVGVFVVAGVYLFNWRQERIFRRNAEQAFAHEHEDVLLQSSPSDSTPQARVEPKMHAVPKATETMPSPAEGDADPLIDYVVEVALREPNDGASVRQELLALTAEWRKPLLVWGYDPASAEWHLAGAGKPFEALRFALQMSNRAGCVDRSQLVAFRDAVLHWAGLMKGEAKCSDVAEAHAKALELDRFCAEVDIAIGVNVVSSDGNAFPGTKIRALAEASGLRLEPEGVFYARNDHGDALYTLDNHEPMPFVPEQIKSMSTSGLTFLLDVPRVSTATEAFDAMLETARSFAATLGGVLVDDNRAPLSASAIDKIRSQLRAILAQMEAAQVPAGGARALRLFS
jgi:FtsZ-interacting cell division protein ZipA